MQKFRFSNPIHCQSAVLIRLGRVDKFDPVTRGCEVQHSKEGIGELIISCGDGALDLEVGRAPARCSCADGKGPSNERIDASAIESWCKAHPNRRQPEGR